MTKTENNEVLYVFRLFITGMTPRSMRAIENIKTLCDEHLAGSYKLEVIDIYQQPELAKAEQIVAAPTLIKKLPLPLRMYIGDLSDKEKMKIDLKIWPKDKD